LFRRYPFLVGDNAAEVMDGRDEGPYAWLTVNFLLGTLSKKPDQKTAAILDMGGASTQMVFEPDHSTTLHNAPPEFRYEPTVKGLRFETYQNSYLGLGLKEAGKTLMRKSKGNDFPCFPPGHSEVVDGHTITNTQVSNFDQCLALVNEHVVRKSDTCSRPPCAFNGVFQPNLVTSFTGPVYAFSYFYDRMEPFLEESGVCSVGKFQEVGRKICEAKEEPFASKHKGSMCMDFAYLYGLLRNGYGLPDDHTLHIRKKIKGIETAWALGAMIVSMQF
jgi:Golgi nucleoside diphosphatase